MQTLNYFCAPTNLELLLRSYKPRIIFVTLVTSKFFYIPTHLEGVNVHANLEALSTLALELESSSFLHGRN